MSEPVSQFSIQVEQIEDYEFRVRWDKPQPELIMDEPPPLGQDRGPSASRLLAASVANCLCASLIFASRKQGLKPTGMRAEVKLDTIRNERRRLRVGKISVVIYPGLDGAADPEKARAAIEAFEDFCTITESVRQGIPVDVRVEGF